MEKKKLRIARRNFNFAILSFHGIIVFALYELFPILLSFPEHFDLISFQIETIKVPLIVYFIFLGTIIFILEKLIIRHFHKNINTLINTPEEQTNEFRKLVITAREDCMNISYKFMIVQFIFLIAFIFAAVWIALVFGRFLIPNFNKLLVSVMRLVMILSAFWLLLSVFEDFAIQNYADTFIRETYHNNLYYKRPDKNTSSMVIALIQIIPLLISIFVISICFSYSNTVEITSRAIATYYEAYLDNFVLEDGITTDSLLQALTETVPLMNPGDVIFIIDENDNIITSNDERISDFMLYYKEKYFFYNRDENGKEFFDSEQDSNVIYESYGIEAHAFLKRFEDNMGNDIYVGVKYFAGNTESFKFLTMISLIMLAVYSIILMYWSNSNSNNIRKIEENMKSILSEKDVMKKNFMPILSNDEVGYISYYYNKIQDKIIVQNEIMFKQEQLSVLGELAGGMAHDINTPISAINTSITMLKAHEKDTKYLEILDTMNVSAERIVNIVNSMRNQIRNLGSNDKEQFELNQLIDDLHILTQNEQKKNGCTFESEVKEKIEIYGEKTKLGQVLTNIVVNGIQAYGLQGKTGNVKLTAYKNGENTCRIEIEDQAGRNI